MPTGSVSFIHMTSWNTYCIVPAEKQIVLPRRIYILNKYMRRTEGGGLIFDKTSPDENCIFEPKQFGRSSYELGFNRRNTVNILRSDGNLPHLRCEGKSRVFHRSFAVR
jgi:hypothetical protein